LVDLRLSISNVYEMVVIMTQLEFETLCNEYLISSDIALENENIVNALYDRDDQKVRELLENEF
jgi:hypothetical protein